MPGLVEGEAGEREPDSEAAQEQRETVGEALLKLAARGQQLGMRGPTDLSTNLDDYLYGDKQ